MKWSDGAPFTADDFVFWYEDMYQNKDLVKSPAPEFSVKGKPGRMVKVDETTVAFEFDEPHFLFPSQLAGDTPGRRRPVAPAVGRSASSASMRRRTTSRSSCRSTARSRRERAGQGRRLRQLGAAISRSSPTGGSTPRSRRCRRGRWSSRSTARPGCSSAIPTTGWSTPPATSCPTSTRCSSRWRRIPRSSTCAPSPASTTTWSASSISPSCRCSSRTPSAASTRSISIPASTAPTPS